MRYHEIFEIQKDNDVQPQPPENFAGAFIGIEAEWADPRDNQLTIKSTQSSDIRRFAVFFKEKIVAVMNLYQDPDLGGCWSIGYTTVDPEFRQKGLMRLLIQYARKALGPISSDVQHTKLATEMWKILVKSPKGLKIVAWWPSSGEKRPASDVPEEEIWNGKSEPILLVEERPAHFRKDYLEEAPSLATPHHVQWGVDLLDAWWQI